MAGLDLNFSLLKFLLGIFILFFWKTQNYSSLSFWEGNDLKLPSSAPWRHLMGSAELWEAIFLKFFILVAKSTFSHSPRANQMARYKFSPSDGSLLEFEYFPLSIWVFYRGLLAKPFLLHVISCFFLSGEDCLQKWSSPPAKDALAPTDHSGRRRGHAFFFPSLPEGRWSFRVIPEELETWGREGELDEGSGRYERKRRSPVGAEVSASRHSPGLVFLMVMQTSPAWHPMGDWKSVAPGIPGQAWHPWAQTRRLSDIRFTWSA